MLFRRGKSIVAIGLVAALALMMTSCSSPKPESPPGSAPDVYAGPYGTGR
jgi:hypothetical protein